MTLAYGYIKEPGPNFAEAAITYIKTRRRSDRFVTKLIKYFGETPIAEIDQAAVAQAAHTLYPTGSASTHNRAVYAPVVSILRLSGARPDIRRPRIDRKPINVPPDEWFDALLSHCPPRLAALLTFLTLTGRRITEASEAIDNGDGSATIAQTKTGEAVTVVIPDVVRGYLHVDGMGEGRPVGITGRRLFPYGDRHNVYRALRAVCKKAGLPYYGTHALGRHAFATRLLKQGKSLKFVQDAGGWKSIKMPAMHYGHLEKSEVQDEIRKVGEEWPRMRRVKSTFGSPADISNEPRASQECYNQTSSRRRRDSL